MKYVLHRESPMCLSLINSQLYLINKCTFNHLEINSNEIKSFNIIVKVLVSTLQLIKHFKII